MVAITAATPVAPFAAHPQHLEAGLWEAVGKASHILEPNSLCVICRKPLLDEDCPQVSDVDLLSIYEKPEEYPERITVDASIGRVFVDILWIPVSAMLDPVEAASYKTLPHLLLESETVWMRSADLITPLIDRIKHKAYEKAVWMRRIGNQINFGDAAIQEAWKNLDFPPAALFFLQTAHSYYITALADCLKHSSMSILTRPITKLRRMAAEIGRPELEQLIRANLYLDRKPSASIYALDRVYGAVSARCDNRQLQGVSARTRGHYIYTVSPLELKYREAVADALIRRQDYANANFYLRFWSYSISRCPVVLEEARQGRKPSFYVPFRAFKESVQATCPEILDDMKVILSGGEELTQGDAEESINGTSVFRQTIVEEIRGRGLALPTIREEVAAGRRG